MNAEMKQTIEHTIAECLRDKLHTYKPTGNEMPFHARLLGKDRLALYSFIHSINTRFGTSIFEPVAIALSQTNFKDAKRQVVVGEEIYDATEAEINRLINELRAGSRNPDKTHETEQLRKTLQGQKSKKRMTVADLYLVDKEGAVWIFDMKSPKPNLGEIVGFKRTLLEWLGASLLIKKDATVHTLIAMPYNPFAPKPYDHWTMKGMLDTSNEVLVAEKFWDFLGGEGCYEDLLGCFERVGIAMREEIDARFRMFL